MADVVTEVLGHPVSYRQVPTEAFQDTLTQHGLSQGWAKAVTAMAVAQDEGIYDAEVAATSRERRAPTSFRQWCQDVLVPAAAS